MKGQANKRKSTSRRVRKKRRKINKVRVGILLFIAVLMISAVTLAVISVSSSIKPNKESSGKDNSLFSVKSILVEGSTHYTDQQIIETSGIYIGQSLFFVNKRKAAENILLNLPYVERVTIKNTSFNQLAVTIEEAKPAGIIEWDSGWLIVGLNGKGLEILDSDSSRLNNYKKIRCETVEGGGVGRITLSNRSQEIINTITNTCDGSNLEDILELDLENFTDIVLNWNNSIEIKLGSDVLLQEKLDFASSTLKRVLEDRDGSASGRIDLRFYSNSNQKAIFTPEDLLNNNE
jgi:hypothetical protein